MKCTMCLSEGVSVDMLEYHVEYGRKIPAPTRDTEPEQEIEYIDYYCPACGDRDRKFFTLEEEL